MERNIKEERERERERENARQREREKEKERGNYGTKPRQRWREWELDAFHLVRTRDVTLPHSSQVLLPPQADCFSLFCARIGDEKTFMAMYIRTMGQKSFSTRYSPI